MKIQLTKAIKSKGQDVFTLDLPLDDLTGNDLIELEEELIKAGSPYAAMEFTRSYYLAVASKASKLPVEALKMMNAKDFSKAIAVVRDFLMVTDSEIKAIKDGLEIPETTPAIS